jgi:hypothetical protein
MKLINIVPANNSHKFTATFLQDNGRKKTTHFGAKGYDDYTITKDKDQRDRYRRRHAKDLATKDPTKAGFLSYYILWGDSTSFSENVRSYKSKFNL